jgi:hypothetical protein
MEKYNLNEGNESLKKILLMMKYDNKKTLSENTKILTEQSKAMRNKGEGLGRIMSLLSGLNPKKNSKLPTWSNGKSIINLGSQNIENFLVKTNIGNLYFFVFKPGGYFTQNNFVLKIKDGVSTIGTWDLDRMYFKTEGDKSVTDRGFDNAIPLNSLTSTQDSNVKDTKTQKSKYKQCSGTYKIYCFNKNVIGKVQGCLGLKQDGYFGPKTQNALKSIGYNDGFTDNDIDTICNKKNQTPEINNSNNITAQSQITADSDIDPKYNV